MKRDFGSCYRLLLLVWVLIINCVIHFCEIPFGWLVFLSNILFFLLEEKDVKRKMLTVEIGGCVGLVLGYVLILLMGLLTPVLGKVFGFFLPLAAILSMLILLHPKIPLIFNNVAFAYLTVACIDHSALMVNLPRYLITFLIGSLVFNGGALLLMKPAKLLAGKQ